MPIALDSAAIEDFQKFLENSCGMYLSPDKAYLLETRLTTLLAPNGCQSFSELQKKAKTEPSLLNQIIEAMTTHETLWFRDQGPWALLTEHFWPKFFAAIKAKPASRIRIWSAACSTGQEPYSMVMSLLEYAEKNNLDKFLTERFQWVATDISASAVAVGAGGRYDAMAIRRGLSQPLREKYFVNQGHVWQVNEKLQKFIEFKPFNLMNDYQVLGKFDLILCRNVLIYFSENIRYSVCMKLLGSLQPDGSIVVGASESLTNLKPNVQPENVANYFYYTKGR